MSGKRSLKAAVYGSLLCSVFFSGATYAAEHIVHVVSDYKNMQMRFDPQEIVIKKGDVVTWVNDMPETHSAVTYPDGYPEGAEGFTSPSLEKQGQKWSWTFKHSGTYEYHCIPHIMMGMRGTVIVDKPSSRTLAHKPTPQETKAYRDKLLAYFDEDSIAQMPDYVKEHIHK